jgi:hypothetical protein
MRSTSASRTWLYLLWLATAGATIAPSVALAKDPSAGEIQLAKEMLRDAIVEEKAGKCGDAIAILKQAAAIKESPDILMHLGDCQAKTGHLKEALTSLQHALELARQERERSATQALGPKIETLKARIPTLTLRVPEGVSGVSAKVDDDVVPNDRLGNALQLDPGEHAVSVTADGRKPFAQKVQLAEKDATELKIELLPTGGTGATGAVVGTSRRGPDTGAKQAPVRSSGIPLGTWMAGSAALALAVGGVVAFVVAGSEASDGKADCATKKTCDEKAIDSVHQLDTAALVLWIGAGIGAGVAVTFFVLDGKKAARPTTKGPPAGAPPARETPRTARLVVGPGSLGLAGRF